MFKPIPVENKMGADIAFDHRLGLSAGREIPDRLNIPKLHQTCVDLYYGLGGCKPHSLREISPLVGVSHERVRHFITKTIQRYKIYLLSLES